MPPPFVRPFHFWCQKVLPLVFDDSLSYYEVLAKMRDYLNEAIKEINSIGSEFDGVKTQITQLQTYVDEYFAGLDVNQAISDKLDDMVESGEMDAVITPIFAAYANPLFAASVADMIATNFAYANYENNKIYTFNQSTGLYQTTGKEFGGVVSSVGEMEDNDKYYALDSNGMLYSYDYPQSSFIATELTYGGYRYGVNAMKPLSNVYVLTTDNHIYTWNGSEYTDSGVIYGVPNSVFTYRRIITSNDDFLDLPVSGWFDFSGNDLPLNKPNNMKNSNGLCLNYISRNERFVIVKTSDGGSWLFCDNKWTNISDNGFETCSNCLTIDYNSTLYCDSNTYGMPVNESDGILKTFESNNSVKKLFFGGESLYIKMSNDGEWVEIANANDVERNSANILYALYQITGLEYRINETANTLTNKINESISDITDSYSAIVKTVNITITTEESLAITDNAGEEMLGGAFSVVTDTTLSQENSAANAKATGEAIANVSLENKALVSRVAQDLNREAIIRHSADERLIESVSSINSAFHTMTESVLEATPRTIYVNENALYAETGVKLLAESVSVKTDETLSVNHVPADAQATGAKMSEITEAVESTDSKLNFSLKLQDSINRHNENQMLRLKSVVTDTTTETITTNSVIEITTQSGQTIVCLRIAQMTDKTLTLPNVAADSKSVGNIISKLAFSPQAYSVLEGAGASPVYTTTIEIFGELPLTKNKVDCYIILKEQHTLYEGNAKLKVQGSSSIVNPEKNYTLKLPVSVTINGMTTDKWNLKCNYIDPIQIRNLLCAKIWQRMNQDRNASATTSILTENDEEFECENDEIIYATIKQSKIAYSPKYGTSDGKLCCVYHDNEFHGVYTIQLPKDTYMLNLSGSRAFMCSVNNWDFNPVENSASLDGDIEIEEKGNGIEDSEILEKINQWAGNIQQMSREDMLNTSITDMLTNIRYMIFSLFTNHWDGIVKNMILYSYDGGNTINLTVWDMDCTFGNSWSFNGFYPPNVMPELNRNALFAKIIANMKSELLSEYNRQKNTMNSNMVWSLIIELLASFPGYLFIKDCEKWGTKGKYLIDTPMSIPLWSMLHEPIVQEHITAL